MSTKTTVISKASEHKIQNENKSEMLGTSEKFLPTKKRRLRLTITKIIKIASIVFQKL